MSDHLLECPSSNTCECNMGPVHKDSCPQRKKFICDRLRACEARVLTNTALINEIRNEQFAKGVQAARDAVAEVEHIGYYAEEVRDAALALIDNLITKNSGENYG